MRRQPVGGILIVRSALTVVLFVLYSSVALAEPILPDVWFSFRNEPGNSVATIGTSVDIDSEIYGFSACRPTASTCDFVSATNEVAFHLSIVSGALVTFTARLDPYTGLPLESQYFYDSGHLTLFAEWVSTDGFARTGTFSAPIVQSHFSSVGVGCAPSSLNDGFVITVDEHWDCFEEWPKSEQWHALGPGTFSRDLAKYLGVKPHSPAGDLFLTLEDINRDVFAASRSAYVYESHLDIRAVSVSEPGLLALALLSAPAVALWRRPRRQAD